MTSFARITLSAVALAVATTGCTNHTDRPEASARVTTTTTPTPSIPSPTIPLPSAEQMRAHLGDGMPAGWDPVDGGNARLWVPHRWDFTSQGSCDGGGAIFVAASPRYAQWRDDGYPTRTPHDGCPPPSRQFLVPTDTVAFVPLSPERGAQPSLTVHGYRMYLVKRATEAEPWDAYDVPQLDVRIATHGPLARRILDTLGPSARYVAVAGARDVAPRHSRVFTQNGVSLAIPKQWSVGTPKPVVGCTSRAPLPNLTVVLHVELPAEPMGGTGPSMGPMCSQGPPVPTTPASNGMAPTGLTTLYLDARDNPVNQWYHSVVPALSTTRGQPITTFHHNATTIAVWAAPYFPNSLSVFFRHDGSSVTHALALGLGRDGRVAAGVLASITATK